MENSEEMKKVDEFMKQAPVGVMAELMKSMELNGKVKEERKQKAMEEGGRMCNNQDCQKKGKERCAGCNFAFYCGKECQVKAWGEHREECKEIRKEFKTVMVRKAEAPPGHTMFDPVLNTVTKGAFRVQVTAGGRVMLSC